MPSVSRTPYVVREALDAHVDAARDTVADTARLLTSSGPLRWGEGMLATVIAFALAVLCLLGVLAFHFPEYLTTPELRHQYSVDVLRQLLLLALLVAGGLSLACIVVGVRRGANFVAFALVLLAVAFGEEYFGAAGLYVVAVISGLTDMDAITLSAAQMTNGGLSPATAWRAILIASMANFLFKFGIVASLGHSALRWRVAQAFGAALLACGAILLLWPGEVAK